jgi:hypothetical protein
VVSIAHRLLGLAICGSVLPADFAWRLLLLATVDQKMIVPHYFSGAFFRCGPSQWIETNL